MSSELPEHYRLIHGPFPLLDKHNIYQISLVDTSKAVERADAGICVHGAGERIFWYPEEALAVLTILRDLESRLLELLQQQGMYTQEDRNEDDEIAPDTLSVEV
jgi:hypothetical protein